MQDYFEYILQNGEKTDNSSIRICVNKIENRIIFKIKTGYSKIKKWWNYVEATKGR